MQINGIVYEKNSFILLSSFDCLIFSKYRMQEHYGHHNRFFRSAYTPRPNEKNDRGKISQKSRARPAKEEEKALGKAY